MDEEERKREGRQSMSSAESEKTNDQHVGFRERLRSASGLSAYSNLGWLRVEPFLSFMLRERGLQLALLCVFSRCYACQPLFSLLALLSVCAAFSCFLMVTTIPLSLCVVVCLWDANVSASHAWFVW